MAMTPLVDALRMPAIMPTLQTVNYDGSFYLNGASTTRLAWVFQAPRAGTLEFAEWYAGYAGGAAAVKVSFQDVDASGNPDGVDAYRVIGTPSTGWQIQQLTSDGTSGGSKKTVTLGQWVALVFEWDSTQSGFYELHGLRNDFNTTLQGGCYALTYTGTWNRTTGQGIWANFAVRYTDGNYYPVVGTVMPLTAPFTDTYNAGSAPDERGMRLVVGVGVRVIGAWFLGTLSGNADLVVYDGDGSTVLASRALVPGYGPEASFRRYREVQYTASAALSAGPVYRLVLKPTSGSNVALDGVTVNSAALLDAYPCRATWHYTARTDAGAWSETATKRPFMGLIVDAVDAAGGGGSTPSSYPFIG